MRNDGRTGYTGLIGAEFTGGFSQYSENTGPMQTQSASSDPRVPDRNSDRQNSTSAVQRFFAAPTSSSLIGRHAHETA